MTRPPANRRLRVLPRRQLLGIALTLVLWQLPALGQRLCAEWEPALGALITWPPKIPQKLIIELARDDDLFVLVANPDDRNRALDVYEQWGLDLERVHTILTSVQTEWTRDYGPHQIFDENGELAIVDAVYIDTPVCRAGYEGDPKERPMTYLGNYPGDDATNVDVARFLAVPLLSTDAYLTGGNFLTDGRGRGFSARAMIDENLRIMEEDEFFSIVERLTGIDDHRILADTETLGIQHIDCWFKLLDEETLLIKRPPSNHPERVYIDRNLERIRQWKAPSGRPYRIVRIDCPSFRGLAIAAYTNSLILNRKVYVPLFGIEADDAALETYRQAMPGYEVHGFRYRGWKEFDALHCRTRAIFDRHMLHMFGGRLPDRVEADEPTVVELTIDDRSEAGLVTDQLRLSWRLSGDADWTDVALQPLQAADRFRAVIPGQSAGALIEYHLAAADEFGRSATLPPTAPEGFYSFEVVTAPEGDSSK
jgi:agmatine/peptidylarginine deiminase